MSVAVLPALVPSARSAGVPGAVPAVRGVLRWGGRGARYRIGCVASFGGGGRGARFRVRLRLPPIEGRQGRPDPVPGAPVDPHPAPVLRGGHRVPDLTRRSRPCRDFCFRESFTSSLSSGGDRFLEWWWGPATRSKPAISGWTQFRSSAFPMGWTRSLRGAKTKTRRRSPRVSPCC